MRRSTKGLLYITVAIVLFCFGILSILSGIAAESSMNNDNWVSASTTVTYTFRPITIDQGRGNGVTRGGIHTAYALSPTYSFVANDGRTYMGSSYSIFSAERIDDTDINEEQVRAHLVEDTNIFYNPTDPRQSAVIHPGPSTAMVSIFFSIMFAIVFILGALAFLKSGIEKIRTKHG